MLALVGRQPELTAIAAALAAACAGGAVLVLRGEPGAGKTALLSHGRGRRRPGLCRRDRGFGFQVGELLAQCRQRRLARSIVERELEIWRDWISLPYGLAVLAGRSVRAAPKKVVVKKDSKTTATFMLEKSMKVTLRVTPGAVDASGEATVELLVSVVRDGEPLPGKKVDVWSTGSTPAETLKVPAVICTAGACFWPTADPGVLGASIPKAVTIDAKGEARLTLRTGMVPGIVTIQAWAEADGGALRTKNLDDVRDEATVVVNARPGASLGSLTLLRQRLQTYAATEQVDLISSSAVALADQLNALAPAAGMADVIFSPVRRVGDGEEAVIASLATTQPLLGRDGAFSTSATTCVIPFRRISAALTTVYGGFAGVVRGGVLPDLPVLGQWLAGTPTTGYTFVAGTAVRGGAPSYWASMGWLDKTVPGLCRG